MPTKRGNSEGTIRKRSDGRWEARITLENGARRSFYAKTRQDVARQLAEATRDREHCIQAVGERQTVREFLEGWVAATEHDVKPRTWRRRGEYVRLHIVPVVGKVHLQKLNAQHIQGLYTRKLKEGLSSTTVHHLHEILHAALEKAVRQGLVYRNVSDMVDPPRMSHHEMTTLAEAQAKALLAAAVGDRLESLYAVAIATGMRLGELLALKWRDVDLDGRTLQVRATLQNMAGRFEFAEPKTSHSRRRIALSLLAVEALQKHQVRQAEERIRSGGAWEDLDLVFPNTVGKPLDGRNLLRYWFRPLVKKAGLPRMRFHDLRHTAATLLLSRGVDPKIVSRDARSLICLGDAGYLQPRHATYAAASR